MTVAESRSLPLLSVVVVAYKSAGEIVDCLGSIPGRIDESQVELIVIDNSPDDGTGDIVARHFPQALYLPQAKNEGFSKANNRGYQVARGRLILFLNPDTVCNREALEHCARRLLEEPDVGLLSPKLVMANGEMDAACRRSIPTLWDGFCRAVGLARRFPSSRLFSGYNLTFLPDGDTYEVGAINGAFMMTRRDVLEKSGLFDETYFMYGDDLDLCIRVRKCGFRVVYDGRVSIVHLKGLSVAKDYSAMSEAIFDANRDVYLKHFNPRGSTLVRWKYTLAFGLWKKVALRRARAQGYTKVRPI